MYQNVQFTASFICLGNGHKSFGLLIVNSGFQNLIVRYPLNEYSYEYATCHVTHDKNYWNFNLLHIGISSVTFALLWISDSRVNVQRTARQACFDILIRACSLYPSIKVQSFPPQRRVSSIVLAAWNMLPVKTCSFDSPIMYCFLGTFRTAAAIMCSLQSFLEYPASWERFRIPKRSPRICIFCIMLFKICAWKNFIQVIRTLEAQPFEKEIRWLITEMVVWPIVGINSVK